MILECFRMQCEKNHVPESCALKNDLPCAPCLRTQFSTVSGSDPRCTSTPVVPKICQRTPQLFADNDSGYGEQLTCTISSHFIDSAYSDCYQRDSFLSQSLPGDTVSCSADNDLSKRDCLSVYPEVQHCSGVIKYTESDFTQKMSVFLKDTVSDRLIGRNMGLDTVDIISLLHGMNLPCLKYIILCLCHEDQQRCSSVSRSWQTIFKQFATPSSPAKRVRSDKENNAVPTKKHAEGGFTSPAIRGLLNTVQPAVTADEAVEHQRCTLSLHQRFVEEAKSLKVGERLTKCPRCQHPSHIHDPMDKGVCTRLGCSYKYCTKCFADYHGSKPCLMQVKRTKLDTIGSRKSKRNLKRL